MLTITKSICNMHYKLMLGNTQIACYATKQELDQEAEEIIHNYPKQEKNNIAVGEITEETININPGSKPEGTKATGLLSSILNCFRR